MGSPAIRNPKRNRSCNQGRASWYSYYAGYSPDFVRDALRFAEAKADATRVLDPWNGSGTTTQVASSERLTSWGFDLNPAMVIVAKAKAIDPNEHTRIRSLLDQICVIANGCREASIDDPLRAWLSGDTAATFRSLDRAISGLLVDNGQYTCLAELPNLSRVSPLASFFYVALFRSLRSLLQSFLSSNPTWIKSAGLGLDQIIVAPEQLFRLFQEEVSEMTRTVEEEVRSGNAVHSVPPNIEIADSSSLPVTDSLFDIVVSSPPYCTRIDYAVNTGPDLAILGAQRTMLRSLRDGMIGTPTIIDAPPESLAEWGPKCSALLDGIREHSAKASSSYYWKTYVQYFDGLFRSFKEIVRALRAGGLCFLVVQDSFYKNLHVDLAGITEQMLSAVNMQLISRVAFDSTRTMAGLNTSSKMYRGTASSTETVLILEKQ